MYNGQETPVHYVCADNGDHISFVSYNNNDDNNNNNNSSSSSSSSICSSCASTFKVFPISQSQIPLEPELEILIHKKIEKKVSFADSVGSREKGKGKKERKSFFWRDRMTISRETRKDSRFKTRDSRLEIQVN